MVGFKLKCSEALCGADSGRKMFMAYPTKFMNSALLMVASTLLLTVPIGGLAAIAGGCGDLVAPGTWTRSLLANGPRYFEMGDGQTYRILPAALVREHPDDTGQWDSIQHHLGASALLTNAPGTPWYSPSDTNLTFEFEFPSLVVKARAARDSSTNSEMEIAGHSGRLAFLATHVGTSTVTNVPETPDTVAYTIVTGALSSARFCFSYDPPVSIGPPLLIRGSPVPSRWAELSWNSFPGRLYQLQFCSDLSSGFWEDLQWPFSGTGDALRTMDVMGEETTQRFYRTLEFP
jgi:hypothetical protein